MLICTVICAASICKFYVSSTEDVVLYCIAEWKADLLCPSQWLPKYWTELGVSLPPKNHVVNAHVLFCALIMGRIPHYWTSVFQNLVGSWTQLWCYVNTLFRLLKILTAQRTIIQLSMLWELFSELPVLYEFHVWDCMSYIRMFQSLSPCGWWYLAALGWLFIGCVASSSSHPLLSCCHPHTNCANRWMTVLAVIK